MFKRHAEYISATSISWEKEPNLMAYNLKQEEKNKKRKKKKKKHRLSIWFPSCFCKDKSLPVENYKIVVVVQLFQKKAQEFLTDKPFQQWHKSSFVLHSLLYLHVRDFQKLHRWEMK